MYKSITTLLVTLIIVSCRHQQKVNQHECPGNYLFYKGTITDTEIVTLKDFSYRTIVTDLSLGSALPDSDRMTGMPNSHVEEIAEIPNWSKEEYEKTLKQTNGGLYLDTTDRDFDKYWYNETGLLCRYETKNFGDIRHNEVCYTYHSDHTMERMSISDVVTSTFRYKNKTVLFNSGGQVIIFRHNIVPDTIQ